MLILFPNQLFYNTYWTKLDEDVFIISPHHDLQVNRLRIAYDRYCIENFRVENKRVNDVLELEKLPKQSPLIAFDPEDHTIKAQMKKLGINVTWLDSPMFLTSSKLLDEYAQSVKGKRLQHKPFYEFVKDRVLSKEIPGMNLPDSQDEDNRKPLPKNFDVPGMPWGAGAGVSAREPDPAKLASMLKRAEWVEEH